MSKATPEAVQAVFYPDSIRDEVAHLNGLLTDSHITTCALFQLLDSNGIHVGSTELIKAREKVEAEMRALRTANAGLVEKVRDRERERDHANNTAEAVLSEAKMLRAKLQVLEAARAQAAANSLANMLSYEELEAKVKRLEEAAGLALGYAAKGDFETADEVLAKAKGQS